jgi:hypothetical protein
MRKLRAAAPVFVLASGLGLVNEASADVVLLSQERSVFATTTSIRSTSATGFGDFSANRLFYQSGSPGYWNGAAQLSTYLPDGATGTGQSIYAEGSTRSEAVGSFVRSAVWTATSTFKTSFRADLGHLMNIFVSTNRTGSGSVTASLKQGSAVLWTLGGSGNENVSLALAAGTYDLEIVASSSLDTAGNGGDALFNMGVGFLVPGPSALAMVALSVFLRRRRT